MEPNEWEISGASRLTFAVLDASGMQVDVTPNPSTVQRSEVWSEDPWFGFEIAGREFRLPQTMELRRHLETKTVDGRQLFRFGGLQVIAEIEADYVQVEDGATAPRPIAGPHGVLVNAEPIVAAGVYPVFKPTYSIGQVEIWGRSLRPQDLLLASEDYLHDIIGRALSAAAEAWSVAAGRDSVASSAYAARLERASVVNRRGPKAPSESTLRRIVDLYDGTIERPDRMTFARIGEALQMSESAVHRWYHHAKEQGL